MSDPIYCLENVPLDEALYGKNLISLGGFAAVDNMFSDCDLQGKKAIDLGFGLGGVAFYLAEKYKMNISGIDVHEWMVNYANKNIPSHLKKRLRFSCYDLEGNIPFESGTFDLVYSKGVLNHVADKLPLFRQINHMLKSDGKFVIADWIFLQADMDATKPLVRETAETYKKVLSDAQFADIAFRDDSHVFFHYVENFIKNLNTQKEFIDKNFGEDIYSLIENQHQELIKELKNKQRSAVRIMAIKM